MNAQNQRHVTVTPSGRVAAVAGSVVGTFGVVLDYPELVALSAASLLGVAWALLTVRHRPYEVVDSSVSPTRVAEGDRVQVRLTVANTTRHRLPSADGYDTIAGRHVPVHIPALPRSEVRSVDYDVPALRRGVFRVGAPTILRSDAFGFMTAPAATGARPTWLTVTPRVEPMAPVPTSRRMDEDGVVRSHAFRSGASFHGIRAYVPGDDIRLIHWRSTARTGRLVVRHNVVPHDDRVLVVLDTNAGSYGHGEASFEDAVRVAASLSQATSDAGAPLRLRTTSTEHDAIDAVPNGGAVEVLDSLATVECNDKSDRSLSPDRVARPGDGASVVLITGPAGDDGSAPALRRRFGSVFEIRLGPGVASSAGPTFFAGADVGSVAQHWNGWMR